MPQATNSNCPVKVSYADDSNCQLKYSYNDATINQDFYITRRYDSRVYIIESQYSLETLLEWDSRRARLDRKLRGKSSRYWLPRGPKAEEWRPIDLFTLNKVQSLALREKGIGNSWSRLRLGIDDIERTIWVKQPFTRIQPAKDIVFILNTREFNPKYGIIDTYKAIMPLQEWLTNAPSKHGYVYAQELVADKKDGYGGGYRETVAWSKTWLEKEAARTGSIVWSRILAGRPLSRSIPGSDAGGHCKIGKSATHTSSSSSSSGF